MITESTWRPTGKSIEKKNTKSQLAYALMRVWEKIHNNKDIENKEEIIKILLQVL